MRQVLVAMFARHKAGQGRSPWSALWSRVESRGRRPRTDRGPSSSGDTAWGHGPVAGQHSLPGRRRGLGLYPVLSLCLVLLATGCRSRTEQSGPAPTPSFQPWNLTIFHTNDMHGAFLPEPASWRDDRAEVGGMIALSWHLARQRKTAPASLLLDAGDFMTGNPITEIAVDGVKGAGFVAMMNALGYDAGVIGNHEFDDGRENARRLAKKAAFPLLAADILDEKGDYEFEHDPVIFQRGGIKVGVMGVSCASLFSVTAHSRTAGLSLLDQARVVREMVRELDPQTDLLVLITHDGVDEDRRLAQQLSGSGLDIIVGGHSHTRLEKPVQVGGILIVQAGSHLKNLGRLDLRVADDHVVDYSGQLIELTAAGTTASGRGRADLAALVDDYQRQVEAQFGEVIGELAQEWHRGAGESNIGDWLTDRLRERAGADVAFLNSGTIRKDLAAGPIRLLDVHEILPFANTLVTFELTGDQILTILNENARAAVFHKHSILQVSGVRYGYRRVGDHVEIEAVSIGGQPLDRNRVYKAAAPDYVAMKSDIYFDLPRPTFTETGDSLTDAIVDAVRNTTGPIQVEVDRRMQPLEQTAPGNP